MKKLISLTFALLLGAGYAYAGNATSDFYNRYQIHGSGGLSAYNKDISTMIGVTDFHTGKGAKFPGLDLGVSVSAVKPSSNNSLSDSGYIYTPFVTAETTLPIWNLDVMARGTSYDGFKSLGGGLKTGTDLFELINISAMIFYDRYSTDWYEGNHYSASATASINVLFLTPYAGIGYDYSDLSLRNGLNGSSSDGSVRYTLGVNVKPFPFLYAYGAYTFTSDNHGLQGGVGFHF